MRFHSTPESVLNGEITILAIIECVVSIALYLALGLYLGTFRYLAWAVVVAPLMLFRTERSAEWGLDLWIRFHQRLGRQSKDDVGYPSFSMANIAMAIVGLPIVGSTIRILSPVYWFLRRPIETLKEAPFSWQRQCLCSDFYYPPEIVPLENTTIETDSFERIRGAFTELKGLDRAIALVMSSSVVVLGLLPPLVYRITFKATAIAYMPFIWVVNWTLVKTLSLKTRLERITKGELEKLRRLASWPILAVLIGKVALIYGWIDLTLLATKFPNQRVMEYFIVPSHWPLWQLTLVSDAVLTFFLFFFADAALARIEGESAWSGQKVMNTISVTSFLRAIFSLITMSHFFYIAVISVVPQTLKHLFP